MRLIVMREDDRAVIPNKSIVDRPSRGRFNWNMSSRFALALALGPFLLQSVGAGTEPVPSAFAQSYGASSPTPKPRLASGSIGEPAGPLPSGSVGSQRESTPTATPARNPNRPSSAPKPETVPGHVVVISKNKLTKDSLSSFRESVSRANAAVRNSTAANQADSMPRKLAETVALVTTEPGQEEDAMKELRKNGDLAVVEPEYWGRVAAISNDTRVSEQENLVAINAHLAWGLEPTMGSGVRVAFFDGGYNIKSADIANIDPADIIDTSGAPDELDAHGPAVLAIAASLTDNNKEIAGVSGGISPIIVKVTKGGIWTSSAVYAGITAAADRGATVGNFSLDGTGLPSCPDGLGNRLDYAKQKSGMVGVAAVGNNGQKDTSQFFAGCPEVLGFGGTTENGSARWTEPNGTGSNYGQTVDFAAPGQDILSFYSASPDGYAFFSGTSAAAPHGTGVAALVQKLSRSIGLQLSAIDIKSIMCSTATAMADFRCGLVNAKAALEKVLSLGPATAAPTRTLVPTPTPTPTSTPKPAGQCEPRPKVITRVGKTSDGRLQATFEATSNPGPTPNEILSIRILGDPKNAEVTVAGSTTPIRPDGIINLSPPGARITLVQRRLTPGPTIVSLTVTDRCGEWRTFFGGGPNAF